MKMITVAGYVPDMSFAFMMSMKRVRFMVLPITVRSWPWLSGCSAFQTELRFGYTRTYGSVAIAILL
ncbi:hypothetical protein ACS0TY_019481 [Phlomoides rotata]